MKRGDTKVWNITVADPSSNQPMNLTAMLLRFTAKRNYTDDDSKAVLQVSSTPNKYGGIVTTLPTLGQATITILPAATVALAGVEYRLLYDLQVTNSSDFTQVTTIAEGLLIITPDVSQTAP